MQQLPFDIILITLSYITDTHLVVNNFYKYFAQLNKYYHTEYVFMFKTNNIYDYLQATIPHKYFQLCLSKQFNIGGIRMNDQSIQSMERSYNNDDIIKVLKRCYYLQCSFCKNVNFIRQIKFELLEELELIGVETRIVLFNMNNLKKLTISLSKVKKNIVDFAQVFSIEHLTLTNTSYTTATFAHLSNLKTLRLHNGKHDEINTNICEYCPKLTTIWCKALDEFHKYNQYALTAIYKFTHSIEKRTFVFDEYNQYHRTR